MKTIILLVSTFLLLSCQTVDLNNISLNKVTAIATKAASLKSTSEEEEIAIGREAIGMLLGALGDDPVFDKSSVQKYVNLVGNQIASHSDRAGLKWHFVVTNDPDINAFAAPGGYVVVTLGLVALLDNEAQLAAVLAHEIVHIEEQHHLKVMQKNGWLSIAADASMLAYSSSSKPPKLDPEMAEKILNASRTLYAKGLDKGDEFAADKRALELLVASGYDPYALVDVLQKLDSDSVDNSKLALLFKTHPSPRTRLDTIAILDADNSLGSGRTLTNRFVASIK